MATLLFLNTRDGRSGNNFNTGWSIQRSQLNLLEEFTLSLQNVEFANSVYPISALNNIVTFDEGGGSLTATLTPNSYTGSELAIELKTQLEFAGTGDFTVTYDSQAKKLTIASTVTYFFVGGVTNNAFDELGITTLDDSVTASRVSDIPINVSGTQYVDLVTNLPSLNYSSSTTAHILARVPIGVGFGQVVFYEPPTIQNQFVSRPNLDEILLQLRDDKGNIWELPANSYLSLVLKLHTRPPHHPVATNKRKLDKGDPISNYMSF